MITVPHMICLHRVMSVYVCDLSVVASLEQAEGHQHWAGDMGVSA